MIHGGEIYDKKIKYDFSVNLNPLPCPEQINDQLIETVFKAFQYPDIEQMEFRKALAKAMNSNERYGGTLFSPGMIIGGNGASELFAALAMMLRPKKVLLPIPSFYGYRHALGMLENCQLQYFELTSDNDFELTESFADAITSEMNAVFLANPNNPTGRCIRRNVLERILEKCRETGTKLVVDECFFELSEGEVSARNYIRDYPDLFVVDAYTKLFSIPGVRVGFLLTQSHNIQNIRRYLPEWNMNAFAIRAGVACAKLSMKGYGRKSVEAIRKERDYLVKELKKEGLRVFESDTNFLLLQVQDGSDLYARLLEKEILIRDCSNFEGLSKGYYRVAIRSHEDNEILIERIREL